MSYLAKVKKLVLRTRIIDGMGYDTKFSDCAMWLSPSGVIVEREKGAVFVPLSAVEMAELADGWREEIDPPAFPAWGQVKEEQNADMDQSTHPTKSKKKATKKKSTTVAAVSRAKGEITAK